MSNWSLSVLAGVLILVSTVVSVRCRPIRMVEVNTSASPTGPYTVTYIGHATVLLRLDGFTVLTDPVFDERVGVYARRVAPGTAIERLPHLDAVLISHGHWDHFSASTLKQLPKHVTVVVPDGLHKKLRGLGFRDVRSLKAWQTTNVGGAEITAVPARHWGGACGYVIRHGKTVYFAGDTGLFDGMRDIGTRQHIDLALLPIGGYRPHLWFVPGLSRAMRRVHMAPEDVPAAAALLGASTVVPIHWGTFKLTGEPIDEPLARLQRLVADRASQGTIHTVAHGETMAF